MKFKKNYQFRGLIDSINRILPLYDHPINLTDEEILDKINIKVIEKYLRNKKLTNLNKN